MKTGYVTQFFYLQYAVLVLVEYVCRDGHRIHVRTEEIDWQEKGFVWQ
ncbi:hypothetical protein [Burkholderia cenocepacia]|nr:hypothetical protein [Burkholderia cenocepacia]MDI9680442.1 hypothetical protein [Burkholderia cenocepacia]